jgi:coenzyme F420-reducing hydrogenase delta subunit
MNQLKRGWIEEEPVAPDGSADHEWEPRVLAFCCDHCAFSAASLAGSKRLQYPAGVRIIHTPCTGKIEMEHILEAFEKGIDGVLVIGCLEGGCHFVEGNLRARRRSERVCEILDEIGLGGERLRMVNLTDSMASEFVQELRDMVAKARALGPNPLKSSKQNESAGEL